MGVKSLLQTIEKVAPQAMKWVSLPQLHGLNMAIDSSTYLMRFLTHPSQKRVVSAHLEILNDSRRGAHVTGLYTFTQQLLKLGVRPLFVFDYSHTQGRVPSRFKRITVEKRASLFAKQMETLKTQLDHTRRVADLVDGLESVRGPKKFTSPFFDALNLVLSSTGENAASSTQCLIQEQVKLSRESRPIEVKVGKTFADFEDEPITLNALGVTLNQPSPLEMSIIFSKVESTVTLIKRQVSLQNGTTEMDQVLETVQGILKHCPDSQVIPLLHTLSQQRKLRHADLTPFQKLLNTLKNELLVHQFRTCRLTAQRSAECRLLLDKMEVAHVMVSTSEIEAELACASIANQGHVDAVLSEDTDTIVTCDKPVYMKYLRRSAGKFGRVGALRIDPLLVREAFGLTKSEFIDYAILCGCDFSTSLPNVGPIKALILLRRFKTIEALLEALQSQGLKQVLKETKAIARDDPLFSIRDEVEPLKGDVYTVPEDFDYKLAREAFAVQETISQDVLNTMNSDVVQRRLFIHKVWPPQAAETQDALEDMIQEYKAYEKRMDSPLSPEEAWEDESIDFVKANRYY